MSVHSVFLLISVFVLVFAVVAVILLFVVPRHIKKKVAACTQPVSAVIVGFETESVGAFFANHIGGAPNYAPIYEFVWNGLTCRKKASLNSSKRPVVGTRVTLYVDPTDINKFYEPNEYKRARHIFNIVGWGMVGMALLSVVVGIIVVLSIF